MGVRVLFVTAGIIWGLVLGPDIGLGVSKMVAGLNWPFIAGTSEWPEWADWIIIASGVITGLASFFAALIIGRNVGDKLEYSHDVRLNSGSAIPWAIIAMGVGLGAVNLLTIEERQKAVVAYVDQKKVAQQYLQEFSGHVHRFRTVDVDWPGEGQDGTVTLSFRGKRHGYYFLSWEVWGAKGQKKPLLTGGSKINLGPAGQNTGLSLSSAGLAQGWRKQSGAEGVVAQDFTLKLTLVPDPTRAESRKLPSHEPGNISDGTSILIDRISRTFPVRFEQQGRQIIWLR